MRENTILHRPVDRAGAAQPDAPAPGSVPGLLARLSSHDLPPSEARHLLGRLAARLSARRGGSNGVGVGRRLTDIVEDMAPHLTVRDLGTLRAHHGGRSGTELAQALIRAASRSSAAIGAAGGALATAQYAVPPTLLATPVQLAAETLAVIAIEVKLVAELHEVYGVPLAAGGPTARAAAGVTAWAQRHGVDPRAVGFRSAVRAARQELRRRVVRRLTRNATTMLPLFTGAVVGAQLNRRGTRKLGEEVARDLAGR